ncbi:MAG: hypothetical protein QNK37_00245 [Acidobacteriota bacterium]|nr:hypothetical protein [Acidobacteriota bacterium]
MRIIVIIALLGSAAVFSTAQENRPEPNQTGDDVPVSGGTVYAPIRGEDESLRDPFTSPFEIDEEEPQADAQGIPNPEDRLPYAMSELELRGIYLQADVGYIAIFEVNGEIYKWYPAGTRFKDADLVNITDGSVKFRHYVTGDDQQVREVVKVLRRGEE